MMEDKVLADGFNKMCKTISASSLKVGGESMHDISFFNEAKGGCLYFMLVGTTGDIVQYCGIFCYWIHDLFGDTYGKRRDEKEQVLSGAWRNDSLYKYYDGIRKGVRAGEQKMFYQGLFSFDGWFALKRSDKTVMDVSD